MEALLEKGTTVDSYLIAFQGGPLDSELLEVLEHPGDLIEVGGDAGEGVYWHIGAGTGLCDCGTWNVELYEWKEKLT